MTWGIPKATSPHNKRHLCHSRHGEKSRCFRSSVPDMGTKTKYTLPTTKHSATRALTPALTCPPSFLQPAETKKVSTHHPAGPGCCSTKDTGPCPQEVKTRQGGHQVTMVQRGRELPAAVSAHRYQGGRCCTWFYRGPGCLEMRACVCNVVKDIAHLSLSK